MLKTFIKIYGNFISVISKPDVKLPSTTKVGTEEILDIKMKELKHALSQIKSHRAPAEDGISKEKGLEGLQWYTQRKFF